MKRRFSAFALALVMALTMILQPVPVQAAGTNAGSYQVTLPEGYDENHAYPVVYVMPQDGYHADDSGIVEKLQAAMKNGTSADMIIVRPAFEEGADIYEAMEALVAEIDSKYNTIADANYRAVVGTGVGGYLAYILGLTEKAVVEVPEETTAVEETKAEETTAAAEEEATAEEETTVAEETTTAEETTAEEETTAAEESTEEEEATTAEEATVAEEETTEEETTVAAEETTVEEETTVAAEETTAEEETTAAAETTATVETTAAEDAEAAAVAEEAETEEAAEEETEEAAPEYTTLAFPKLFKYIASTRGDFVSSENPWYSVYGDVYEYLNSMGSRTVGKFYTYMDAPVSDAWTDMKNSTDDMGEMLIGFGLAADVCEFTVRSGAFTDSFLTESVNRIADRITNGMMTGIVSGSVSLANAALTSAEEKAEATYTINVNSTFGLFSSVEEDMEITVSLIDPNSEEVLTSSSADEKAATGETVTGTLDLENVVNGSASTVQLSVNVLGTELVLGTATLARIQDTVIDGDYQYIDLMGDWYFHFTGNKNGLDATNLLETAQSENWPVVQPALAWWTKGFGDVTSTMANWPSYWDYGIIGDGYYVRSFEVPESFDAEELILSVGYLDDRGEVYINGQLVGATGMKDGTSDGDSAWAIYSYFDLDSSVLNIGGTNTIVVRCQNDGIGGGGWYSGPIAIYSKTAFESDESTASLFNEYSFESSYAASAQGKEGNVENKYLVYLPDGYYESDKYYPTVYLMHQYNSDHTSYIIDDVDTLIDEAIKQALIDEMIVVVPNSSESSWWRGDWMKMVTEELVPLIDSQYRTIDDARYRFTAGCSMGGQGAFGVALTNPDLFSGAISFFGAFSMGLDASPNVIAENESAEYLKYYSMYFICGNQDVYKFGVPAIQLHQTLLNKDVAHEFFIDNGSHDSAFYLPHFIEAFVYLRNNMYQSDEAVEDLLTGKVTVDTENGVAVKTVFEALKGIEEYYNVIPDSSYTKDSNPDLSIPLTIEVVQNGEVVFSAVERDHAINAGDLSEVFKYDITAYVDADAEYTITYKAAIFDRVVELASVTMNGPVDDEDESAGNDDETGTNTGTDTGKDANNGTSAGTTTGTGNGTGTTAGSGVDTGDHAPIALYVVVMAAAVSVIAAMFLARKRRKS